MPAPTAASSRPVIAATAVAEITSTVSAAVGDACLGYEVGIDLSNNTINKKIREAQLQQWNLLLVVGEAEAAAKTVTVRDRADPKQQECLSMPELLEKLRKLAMPSSQPPLDVRKLWSVFVFVCVLAFELFESISSL